MPFSSFFEDLPETDRNSTVEFDPAHLPFSDMPEGTPLEIRYWMDNFNLKVRGQYAAKQALALALALHDKKINYANPERVPSILLLGPTGTGKSLLSDCLRELISIPFTYCAIPTLTNAHYRGVSLLSHVGRVLSGASYGVMWVDEIDKMYGASNNEHPAYKKLMEHELIDLLGSREVSINGSDDKSQKIERVVDPSNILFIFSGAFVGLSDIVAKRLGLKRTKRIGFGNACSTSVDISEAELLSHVTHQDLIEFGMMPEFAGRIGDIAVMSEPTAEDYYAYIKQKLQKDGLANYRELMSIEGRSADLTDEAVRAVSEWAVKLMLGYRGVDQILHRLMREAIYAPVLHAKFDEETVNDLMER